MSEQNENKSKKCMYCGSYEAYYVKGLRRFESIKCGYCSECSNIVANNHSCDRWKSCSRRIYMRKKVASRALYEILMDISAIRQILQENQDEGKNL